MYTYSVHLRTIYNRCNNGWGIMVNGFGHSRKGHSRCAFIEQLMGKLRHSFLCDCSRCNAKHSLHLCAAAGFTEIRSMVKGMTVSANAD